MNKRSIFLFTLLLLPVQRVWALDVLDVVNEEQLEKLSETSLHHVVGSAENQIEKDELELLDVEIVEEDGLTVPLEPSAQTGAAELPPQAAQCTPMVQTTAALTLFEDVSKIIPVQQPKKKRYIYFTWGYNRNFHTTSDATFQTKDGTFTIHDAIGYDRPSYDWRDYVYPQRIPIPQYNLRVGYEINDNWDIVAGLDHMKWVFQNQYRYEVTGDYNHTVFVPHPSGDPALLQGLSFDEVKETGDMRWLSFDHTNGYNYVHVGGIYKSNLFTSANGNWKLDTGLGFGAGLMVPQTTVKYHQDGWWNWEGVDNNFHIAGFGGHAEAKMQLGYKNFFIEPVVRGTYIKINNALVQSSGEKLSHTPIGSIQFIVQAGYKIPLRYRKAQKALQVP